MPQVKRPEELVDLLTVDDPELKAPYREWQNFDVRIVPAATR